MKRYYYFAEAAEILGMTTGRLRQMALSYWSRCPDGKGRPGPCELRAERVDGRYAAGYCWRISESELDRIKRAGDIPSRPGLRRGQKIFHGGA